MHNLRSFPAPRPAGAPAAHLRVERLEDRTAPAGGEWVLWLEGLSGATPAEQVEAARALIAAHPAAVEVAVVGHTGIDGNVIIQVPELTPMELVDAEFHDLPGFVEVLPAKARRDLTGTGQVTVEPGPSEYGPGPNVNVGLFSNEPHVAVNPLNPQNVVVGNYNNGSQTLRISLDGGATFPISRNGVLPAGQSFFQGDDSLTFDAQGRLFWSYLTGGTPAGPNVTVLQVNPATGVPVGSPRIVATSNLDKQWLAGDANPASPFANNLYLIWHDFNQLNAPTRFARSTDQGATWTVLPGNLHPTNQGFTWPSEVAVAPNGDVWVAWHTNTNATTGEVRMRRSTDGGLTFGPEIIPFPAGTAATTTNSAGGVANKITGLHVWLQGSMQPRILTDPARPGHVYVVSVDDPDAFVPTNDPSDIVIARSTDNGATWTRSTISQGAYGNSEFMPAAAIDAGGNIAVTWYDNRRRLTVPDALGGTHFLLDLFSTTSVDGGLTFSPPAQVNNPANTFDPERGAPDRFGNHTLRIGEYNGLALVNGTAYAAWAGNTATGQQVVFDKFSVGFTVAGSTPAAGSLVTVPPTAFVIRLTGPVNPATVQAGDLTVNGLAADAVALNDAGTEITFHYNTSPVTADGPQSMAVAAGALTSLGGAPLLPFSAGFRYDPLPLAVTSTSPPFPGGAFTLPAPFTYDVHFSEAFDPASLQAADLVLSGMAGAAVTGVTARDGNTTARFTIGGVTGEGSLTATIGAGALADPSGNPSLAFAAAYAVDHGTVPYPVPLAAKDPRGSLIYDPSISGQISFAGDADTFTLDVDPGQTITVRVTAAAGVRPTVALRDPAGGLIGAATAAAAGQAALVQTAATTTGGTYTITVGDAGTATGAYTVQVILNAALEGEGNLAGVTNNTPATAQDLSASFLTVQTPQAAARRGAASGGFAGPDEDYYAFTLAAGQPVTLSMAAAGGGTPVFGPRTDVAGFAGPVSVTYGDLNGDGKQDLVAANYNAGTVSVRPGNGAGGFGTAATYFLGASNPWTVALGDVNGDGKRDIVTANVSSNTLSVLLGTGTGTFGTAASYLTGSSPYGVAVGDLNGDGIDDVVSANYNSNNVTVRLGQLNGILGPSTAFAVNASFFGPTAVALGDLNADGKLDVVTGNYNGNNTSVFLGNGLGGLGAAATFAMGTNPWSVALGDVNGDARLDVVTGNYNGHNVSVRLGDGAGGFGAAATYASGGFNPVRVAIGDVNADGKADIAAANQGNNLAGVLVNAGGGTFGPALTLAAGTAPYGVALADLNGDGLPDLSTANQSSNTVSVWLNATPRTRLELRDAAGTVLAAGAPADNLTAGVNNFVAPAAGTYYARVSGSGTGTYNLVVTRDAAFDTEANNSFATAQPLAGAQGALGAVGTLPLTAATAVVPGATANAEGDFGNGFPFHISAFGIPSMRYQQIYAGSQFGGGSGVIDKIRFRKDVNAGNFSGSNIDVKINLSYSATSPTAPSTVFANNVGGGVVTVFDGLLNLSSIGSGSPNPFDIVIDVADLFNYNPAQGHLLVDVFMRNSPATNFFDAVGTSQTVTSRIFSNASVNDPSGSAFISGLVTRFDFVPPVTTEEDWYTVDVAGPADRLRLETGTPADGPHQFANSLNPRIELYDPAGALVASGTPSADGRNEFIQYQPLTSGAYRVRVTSDGASAGEYFLSKNFSPVVTGLAAPSPVDENGSTTFTGTINDPDGLDAHTVLIDWGPGEEPTTLNLPAGVAGFSATHQYLDDNPTGTPGDTYPISVTVTDNHGAAGSASTDVTVNNVAPGVTAIAGAPAAPVAVGPPSLITVTSSFTDPGTADSHTAVWNWGDGTETVVPVPAGTATALTASHSWTAAGVYSVTLTVTDDDTGLASTVHQYVVVYDPSDGFVTGGGWFDSPAGAYPADPTQTGRATFGFVSKYLRGTTVPDGNTRFLFHAAGLDFKSTGYDWLVISGARAQFKGEGTVNGAAGYGFLLTGIDGQVNGGGGTDKFRIKVWDKATGAVVYDNQTGAAETAAAATALGGGSVHIQAGPALTAAGGEGTGTGVAPVTAGQLRTVVREAVRRWNLTGLTPAERRLLRSVTVELLDLDGATLGVAEGITVRIDPTAAGWGWYVDPTPRSDREFRRAGDQGEQGKMDLLTAVMHEFGHVLGRDHESDGVMGETLTTGTREAPDPAHALAAPAGKPAAPSAKAIPKAGWMFARSYRR